MVKKILKWDSVVKLLQPIKIRSEFVLRQEKNLLISHIELLQLSIFLSAKMYFQQGGVFYINAYHSRAVLYDFFWVEFLQA